MAHEQETVQDPVGTAYHRIEPLLQRSQQDPLPVVLMTCGIAADLGSGKSTLAKAVQAKHSDFARFSIDAIIADRHGIYDRDYAPEEYDAHQNEAEDIYRQSFREMLIEGKRDIVLDRSFYAKSDRDEFRELAESLDGRAALVYLMVPKEELWRRIVQRRNEGVNADSARELSWELLGMYLEDFEEPKGESEVVIAS